MRCPNCYQFVDPGVTEDWEGMFGAHLEAHQAGVPLCSAEIVGLVLAWDDATGARGGQSTLPTELRDLLREHMAGTAAFRLHLEVSK